MRPIITSIAILALSLEPLAAEKAPSDTLEFTGVYDGNSFETASAIRILEDGTFEWYISVGALDLRAKGTWARDGDTIAFTSFPKPVPPEFVWSGFSETPDQPFLRIVNAADGGPFDHASITVVCANGAMIAEQVHLGIWSPSESDGCDVPEKIRFSFDMFSVRSRTFDLTGPQKPRPGQTLLFQFRSNDIGLADFSGVTGRLEKGALILAGPLGNQKLRKVVSLPGE